MKLLYLDCGMGAAGDMLAAALLELLPEPRQAIDALNAVGIPDVVFAREDSVKCGIRGTHLAVTVHGEAEDGTPHAHARHSHASPDDIARLVTERLTLEDAVRSDVLAVYRALAEAESHVHGVPVSDIHFHEVGTMDALADITAVCWLLHRLAPDEIVASPVRVGSGSVRCAHGVLPVPAPATAYLLRGVPMYAGDIASELCTPTGAALLRHFVSRFDAMPLMTASAVGYGMGRKDFAQANCLPAILGVSGGADESVCCIRFNVDDMTGEELGYAAARLYAAGALDVFTIAVNAKKGRPGTLVELLCREADRKTILETIFRCTSTIGVRETPVRRHVLERHTETLETPYGSVRRKDSTGFGVTRRKYEYEDLARIARERDLSVAEARRLVEASDPAYDG